jgi:hypothetical protein
MKNLTCILTLGLALALGQPLFAQAKKKPAADAKPAAEKPVDAKPADAKPAAKPADAKAARPLPFYSEVDEIDAAGKSFTHNNADGKKVKNVVTDKTVIEQEEKPAKFEDIKVGDTVSGLRHKTNADGTEYEVVKITKFGPKPAKAEPAKGEPAKKPEKPAPKK